MRDSDLPQAVLWDMDGTLVDSEPYWMAAEFALAERHGARWTHEQAMEMVGNALPVSAAIFQQATGVPGSVEEVVDALQSAVIDEVRKHGAPWRPGALELLATLRAAEVPCALVTMSYASFAEAVVAAAPPGSFELLVTGDAVTRGKPNPEPYLTAAERLGVEVTRCVALEDSVPGATSALAAGARTIAIPAHVAVPARPGLSRVPSLETVDLDLLAEVLGGRDVDHVATGGH